MSAPGQMNGDAPIPAGSPLLPDGTVPENPILVVNALIRALRVTAENAAGSQDAREVKEYAAAAKDFADALVVMDPTRLQGGDTAEARREATPPKVPGRTDGDRDRKMNE